MADLCGFLQVDPALALPILPQVNVTMVPYRRWAVPILRRAPRFLTDLLPGSLRQAGLARLRAWTQTRPPPLDPALRRKLNKSYRGEIIQLQALIGRDLNHWLR